MASIVHHAIETQQEAMCEMVSSMLTEALKSALIPFNGAILRMLKEEMQPLSKSLVTITTNMDNLQGSLRKKKKNTNLCLYQTEQMQ